MANKLDHNQSSGNKLPDIALSPAALHSNTNTVDNNPNKDTATGSGQELDQFPNDFKIFLKYLVKREDDRIFKEEERARKDEERAERLYNVLSKSLESPTEQTDRLQRAIVEAIRPNPSQNLEDKFWNAYRTVSEEHDNEFRAKHNGNLDTSLIFAGLFSAVSSAFVIQIQSNLTQNPDDVTQALLRLLIHSVNASIFPGPDLIIPEWGGPPPSIVAVEGMLYISFFATLLVALLAVLGKQWLAYCARVGMRGTIRERGIERQKKFDGFRRWGFEYVMMALPILLQISLLLFGAAITVYLWNLQRTSAGIILAISLVGIAAYVVFVLSDIFGTDSPFRTPLSAGLLKIGSWVKIGFLSMNRLLNGILLSCRGRIKIWRAPQDVESILLQEQADENTGVILEGTVVRQHADKWEYPHREIPLLGTQAMGNRDEYDCLAVLWMLDTSTDPNVVAAAGSMAVGLQWSLNIDFIPPLTRLRDTFMGCFEGSPGRRLRDSAVNHAIACGQAYRHLYVICRSAQTLSQSEDHDIGFPDGFFHNIIGGDSHKGPFDSAELNFVYSQLRGRFSWVEYSSFSPLFFRWALHILPYYHYFKPRSSIYLPAHIVHYTRLSSPRFVDRSSFTNLLLCLGSVLEFPLNSRDLAVINKGEYCEKVLKQILQHLVEYNKGASHSEPVCGALETIMIYLKNMDHPLDLSDNCYKEYIYQLCGVLPPDTWRTKAAFTAIQLLSVFQEDLPVVFNLTHDSEPSSKGGEEWTREVSEYIHRKCENLGVDNEWGERIVQDIEDHLRVLIQVPHFGRYKPSHKVLRVLSDSMSPGGNERKHLRRLAYIVICLACDHWFDDEDLRPVIQQLNIFSRLGLVADKDVTHYGYSYMQMVAKLSRMHAWAFIIRYDVHRWIYIYTRFHRSEESEGIFIPIFKNVAVVDDEELEGVGTGNTSVLTIMALENVWRNFDFSAKIAIESFCRLATCTWTFLNPDAPPMFDLSTKIAGDPVATRPGSAIHHARNSLLGNRTGMEQEEIEVVEDINKELIDIEECLRERLISDNYVDSEQSIP